jgi:Cu/Ag efflux pump CusA
VQSLVIGLVLLVLALGAFLYNWRTALISIATMALSLGAAWLVLWAAGATLNLLIVAGLVMALAVIVDDSIVDLDAIRRRLAEREPPRGRTAAIDTIVAASLEIRGRLLWALAIVVVSVAPVLVLGEVSGAFLRPLAFTYALAILVSMVALTVTGAGSRAARPGLLQAPVPRAVARRGYAVLLGACVRRPAWPFGAAAVVILGGSSAAARQLEPRPALRTATSSSA